jgi:ubiquinone/menaquinone biosynthesis C-methylase UbiE
MSRVHDRAAVGFDRAAADYERGRPGYPEPAVATLIRELEIGPDRTVVDLAAGTGKLSRALLASGARVIAIEPVAGMRKQLVATTPRAEALDGTAEQIPLADSSADAVAVAQAFHWFDAGAAAREIHRVLRPGGGLAVIWNSWDESVPWVGAMQDIVHEHASDAPRQANSTWQRELPATGLFTDQQERTFANLVPGDLDAVRARVASTSYIAALEPAAHQEVLERVRAVVTSQAPTRTCDQIEMPYTTHLVWCRARERA